MFWSAVTKEGKYLMQERNVLSPYRDRGTVMSLLVEVAASSLAEVAEDRGEEDSGLRNIWLLDWSRGRRSICSPVRQKWLTSYWRLKDHIVGGHR